MRKLGVLLLSGVMAMASLGLSSCSEDSKEDEKDVTVAYGTYAGTASMDAVLDVSKLTDEQKKRISKTSYSEKSELKDVTVKAGAKKGEMVVEWKDEDGDLIGFTLVEGMKVSNGVLFNVSKNGFSSSEKDTDAEGVTTELRIEGKDGLREYALTENGQETKKYEGAYLKAGSTLAFGFTLKGEIKISADGAARLTCPISGTVKVSLKKK